MKHVIVTYSTFIGQCVEAEHYYARAKVYDTNLTIYELVSKWYMFDSEDEEDLRRKIGIKEAKYLNKKTNVSYFREGQKISKFNSINEIKKAVVEYMKKNNIDGDAALKEVGSSDDIKDDMYIINTIEELKPTGEKIQIRNFQGFGSLFANLTEGSIHDVIETPAKFKDSQMKGVWVMGVSEPVKVLDDEYIKVK